MKNLLYKKKVKLFIYLYTSYWYFTGTISNAIEEFAYKENNVRKK